MKQLATIEEFRAALANRALVLVRDSKYGARVHQLPCTFVTEHNFKMKVLVNPGRAGGFFELSHEEAAGMRHCPKCQGS